MTNIPLPWHPESEKPSLSYVIGTNGAELYWIARYDNEKNAWLECGDWDDWEVIDGMCWVEPRSKIPYAWCDMCEFELFKEKKELHMCKKLGFVCYEDKFVPGLCLCYNDFCTLCEVCPFCGYKAGER